MHRSNVQRGIAALAFVLVMALAGAEPVAAAQRPGMLDRLASAWSAMNIIPGGQVLASFLDRLSGRSRLAARKEQDKRGLGSDPNGLEVTITTEDDPNSTNDPEGGR